MFVHSVALSLLSGTHTCWQIDFSSNLFFLDFCYALVLFACSFLSCFAVLAAVVKSFFFFFASVYVSVCGGKRSVQNLINLPLPEIRCMMRVKHERGLHGTRHQSHSQLCEVSGILKKTAAQSARFKKFDFWQMFCEAMKRVELDTCHFCWNAPNPARIRTAYS